MYNNYVKNQGIVVYLYLYFTRFFSQRSFRNFLEYLFEKSKNDLVNITLSVFILSMYIIQNKKKICK